MDIAGREATRILLLEKLTQAGGMKNATAAGANMTRKAK
jgi:hypothetical protein